MTRFTEILTASDADLLKVFHQVKSDPDDDFIDRINKVAKQFGVNHTQLVCALGFNRHTRDLPDTYSKLGFRSHKLLAYRCNELFRTDTYSQLDIENILDIYFERPTDQPTLDALREMIDPRLEYVEEDIDNNEDPSHVISYRMEIHAVYSSGIADEAFAERRLNKDIGRFRVLSDEANAVVEAGLLPPSNLFYMDGVEPAEKKVLIEKKYIDNDMIKNRLQNKSISQEERDLLEEYF